MHITIIDYKIFTLRIKCLKGVGLGIKMAHANIMRINLILINLILRSFCRSEVLLSTSQNPLIYDATRLIIMISPCRKLDTRGKKLG